jgi:poly(A) polymerase
MAVKLDVGSWRDRPGMGPLLDALGGSEGLTRYVGGAVRDQLLGLSVNDVDLATRLRPEEVVQRLKAAGIKAIPTGIEHGTITAVSQGQVVEITTLRRDVSTDGRRATVAFTDDWAEDASRRDFTINALSADPATGEISDFFGGLADLDARRVRFIGDPIGRIAEDHLRILRFFRFHARFGQGSPDVAALDACTARANDLMALSRERIADELLKLLGLPEPGPTLAIMIDRGIFRPVLPEIDEHGLERARTLMAAERQSGTAPDPLRRLAALLPRDAQTAARVAARLKLSNKVRKRVEAAADPALPSNPRELAYRAGTETAVDRLLLDARADEARALAVWPVPRLPIGGGDLIRRGLTEGPQISRTLRRIEDRWIAEGFPDGARLDVILDEAVAAPD